MSLVPNDFHFKPLKDSPDVTRVSYGAAADIWKISPTDSPPRVQKIMRVSPENLDQSFLSDGPKPQSSTNLWKNFIQDYCAKVGTWSGLDHPNVVRVFGFGDCLNLQVAFYENGCVRDYLKSHSSEVDKVAMASDVLAGMQYLHGHNPPIIHGSLNAGKLFVDYNGRTLVGEFGLTALCYPFAAYVPSISFSELSRWLSPELFDNNTDGTMKPTVASDIWALGCTLFEIATETLPYSSHKHVITIQRAIMARQPPGRCDDRLRTSDFGFIWPILESCWALSPEKRPSMSKLAEDFGARSPKNQPVSTRVRLRIQSIEVGFMTPPQYPINVKLLSNGRLLYNLKAVNSGQLLHWENINPIDVDQSGSLEIRVYELHWIGTKRERMGAVSFKVHELVNSGSSVTARDDSGTSPFSVSVTLVPTSDSHQHAANASVAISPSLLESMGRTRSAVETILKIGQSSAELYPIAKLVIGLFTQAWDTLRAQDQCDALVAKLVTGMGDVLPHVAAVEDHAKLANMRGTLKDLLLLVEDTSRFVIEYKSDGAAVRALHVFVSSSAQGQVDMFVDRFGRLKENFDRGIATQVETLLDDADRALLKPLIVPGAAFDLSRCCLEGTRMEILDDIRNWALSGDSTGLYWLYGPTGCGKTAVSTSVSEFLHDAGDLGGSFFCKRDNEHLRKPENVLSHLAASLAFRYPEYGTKLVEALRRDPELADSPTKTRFAGLIVAPLQSIGQDTKFRSSIIVVDAIDECGTPDSRAELVRCLLELSRLASWLKVLVTSRPNQEIHNILGFGSEGIERRDLFAEGEASVSRDIFAYVRSCLNAIPAKKTGSQWPDEGEINQLSMSSNGLFIWARTACSLIQQSFDPDATLKQILAGQRSKGAKKALGEIYTTALNEGLGEANDDANIIQLCVGAIVLTESRRPLPDTALAAMLAGRIQPHVLSRVVNRLGSVLYRDDNSAVRVLHQSFSDYMMGNDCPEEYRTDVAVQNAELAASCLQVMLRGLRFNVCGLESSCVMNRDVPDLPNRIEKNISLELAYSCLYWTTHLVTLAFTATLPGTLKLLDEFLLGAHPLYWIEVASLTEELYAIAEAMKRLMNWINDPQSKYTTAAYDVYRFLWAAAAPISASTPHLYVSALGFGAANYETLRALKPQFPNTLSVECGASLWKLPWLRKIDVGARVSCIALSSGGRRIVSGSWENTVRIWDAYTSAAILELRGHSDSVTCVAISSDSQRIVSGSSDKTVRVWDAHTGAAILEPLRGHSDSVTSVAVSSDGQRIVSGSSDKMVRIWDAHTGVAILEPLQGHSSWVACVAISSDGQRIVSGSSDGTVRVWDAHTGAVILEPLRGHSDSVTCVAISSDGHRVVSGSLDKTVRIWDAYTGAAILEPLQGHWGSVTSIAISSDSHRIVSGSSDETVRVWDAHTGAAILEPLQGHSESVTCVAISSDGQDIVSGSDDSTVRVWDVQPGAVSFEPLFFYPSVVTSVAGSSNGDLGLRTFQEIFQNSPSSSIRRYSRVGSPQLSMLCDQQGWVRGSSGEPLLWIAPEYQRTRVDHPIRAISTNPEDHPVYFDLSKLKIGNDWVDVFD